MKRQVILAVALLTGCTGAGQSVRDAPGDVASVLDRITWGINEPAVAAVSRSGIDGYIGQQLRAGGRDRLPADAQSQFDEVTTVREGPVQLLAGLQRQRDAFRDLPEGAERMAARRAYEDRLNALAREAATRHILRALYGEDQLPEQMVWFWLNHFNVYQGKNELRALVGDYEDSAIRPHALGRFRDLLRAVVFHPAMLIYLDNERNGAQHINENYARELMELHTLGVDGGYSQRDVQELARILTGLGVNFTDEIPRVGRRHAGDYWQGRGAEFNPNRHDYGDKTFLGHAVRGRGLPEIDEVIDLLSRSPATARFVSRKMAMFWVADDPPPALVERMAQAFLRSDGDIAVTLAVALHSPEFRASLGHKFRDPVHYVLSAVRLAYGDKVILNAAPVIGWLNRMGEPLYGRATPDGYPLIESAWTGSGQLATRFEIARAIGNGSAGLFRSEGEQPRERAAFPQLANALFYSLLQQRLGAGTRKALEQANSPQEWNLYLLASPEMMYH